MRADVAEVGDHFSVLGATDLVEEVLEAVRKRPNFAPAAGVPEATAEHVALDIEKWSAPLR